MEEFRSNITALIKKILNNDRISSEDFNITGISSEERKLLKTMVSKKSSNEGLDTLKNITEEITNQNISRVNDLIDDLDFAEKEIMTFNNQLNDIFSSIKDKVFILDKNKIITKVNKAACDISVYGVNDFINKKFVSFFKFPNNKRRVFFNQENQLLEFEAVLNYESESPVHVVLSVIQMINKSGRIYGYVVRLDYAEE
ncbi:MAG: PAS domain-containing protein, partial [Flavobacteriales bacterium]|nr:PAS domain-containing protein [Flavobacteriales bacterium]